MSLVLIVSGFCLTGCDARDRFAADGVTVRDSAGVAIVENSSAEGRIWHVVDTTSTRVLVDRTGDTSSVVNFYGRVAALVFNDGRVVAADLDERQILLFEGSGDVAQRFGRKGAGPQEFEGITALTFIDSGKVAVDDAPLGRFTIVSESGAVETLPPLSIGYASFIGKLPGDSWVFTQSGEFSTRRDYGTRIVRLPETVFRISGNRADTILRRDGVEILVHQTTPLLLNAFEPPYPRRAFILVSVGRVVVAEAGVEEVKVYNSVGELTAIWRWPAARLERSAEYEQQFLEGIFGAAGVGPPQNELRSAIEELFASRRFSSFDRVLLDEAGQVWFRTPEATSNHRTRWTVLDPTGRVLGLVIIPQDCRVVAVGANHVLCRPRTEQLKDAPLWLWEHRPSS